MQFIMKILIKLVGICYLIKIKRWTAFENEYLVSEKDIIQVSVKKKELTMKEVKRVANRLNITLKLIKNSGEIPACCCDRKVK